MTIKQPKISLKISEVVGLLGISADTLRYYEKIGLLETVPRMPSGIRCYQNRDISNLRFIQRAKLMNFSLEEISRLLKMRKDPQNARIDVRELTHTKLAEVESHLQILATLRNELTLLVNLCDRTEDGCPILDELQSGKPE